jgi:CHAT domain-containing protein
LHQLTSTRYLAIDLKKKEQEPIGNSIALFGGINYDEYPSASIDEINKEESLNAAVMYKYAIASKRDSDNNRSGVKYLPGTKTEVNNITQLLKNKNWSVDLIEGENASENKLKSYSGNNSKNILHIATHGFAFPDREDKIKSSPLDMIKGSDRFQAAENPMIRSGLYFAGANLTLKDKGDSLINKTNEDGVLTAYELAEMDLSNTKLAVLSACETGKGAIQGSEGTFGLKRALKLAGVDNMIVSLWKVPDDATSEMMTLFYNELAKTKKTVSSFETAQKVMRLNHPKNPERWAGFIFVR